ncbi:MAG: hypothetical protein LBG83_01245 [Oscillospiraceae bacterium]|jgi:hypothetical protein|nr:hypothetical protein [Oscillospiraceae bacterium]
MYLGLIKRGTSFMAAFFACIACVAFFERYGYGSSIYIVFLFALPVIWFIAFFDFWRYPRMTAEERLAVKDEFLMVNRLVLPAVSRQVRMIAGAMLILAGFSALYGNFFLRIMMATSFFNRHPTLSSLLENIPNFVAAALIIALGILLLFWKGKQIRQDAAAARWAAEIAEESEAAADEG